MLQKTIKFYLESFFVKQLTDYAKKGEQMR